MKLHQVLTNGAFFRKVAVIVCKAVNGSTLCLTLVCCAALQSSPVLAYCPHRSFNEQAVIDSVVDGDTIRLGNHQLVRLIGVNTPEIHYDGTPSEPMAQAAKDFLTRLLHDQKSVGLVFEPDTHDRYGRLLAHVFYSSNGSHSPVDIQQKILENGMGYWIAIPPNIAYLNCYQDAEARARQHHLGLWSRAYISPKNAADKTALVPGFQRLRGKITAVYRTRKSVWLKFNNQVALRIAVKDIHNFQMAALYALKGTTLTARGWLYKRDNKLIMPISLPDDMELQP